VQAVVTTNNQALTKTPGVGKKTAERIALELRVKLAAWRQDSGLTSVSSGPSAEIQEDVEMTLLALGYTNAEISDALSALSQNESLRDQKDSDQWIRQAIAHLS
jgi:Holliday junction DNA helicase RuvA